jgi:ABC-2 type transport system permease protein
MSALAVLVRHRARRDRVQLAIWIASTALLALFSASAVAETYGGAAERAGILRLAIDNPAILMVRGLPQGASLPAFIFFQIFTFLALLAALMSSFLAVRHSRAEEESGRAELVASTAASRSLATTATIVHGVLADLVLGVAVAVAFVAGGLPVAGSLVTGAATAAVGVAFVGVGLLGAQFSSSSRGANTIGVSAVLAAFVLRGVGDALGEPDVGALTMTSAWPSWLSPIGWAQHVAAYTRDDLTPLLLCLALAAASIAVVLALQSRRDSGASLTPERAGRVTARRSLNSSFALTWRLQWPTIVAWCVGGAVFGLLSASLAGVVVDAAETNPQLAETLRAFVSVDGGSMSGVLVSAMFEIVGVIAAACAAQVVMRARQEESSGAAELLLATPLHRARWLASYLAVAAIAACLVLLSGALASVAVVLSTGDAATRGTEAFLPALAQLPAALVYLGVAALLFVVLPRLTAPLGWTLVGAGVFLGVFGSLIGVPEWLSDLAPFTHTPVVVGGQTDWSGGAWMLAIGLAAASMALVLMRRRELRS